MSPATERVEDSPAAVAARADRYNDLQRHAEAERIVRRALRAYPGHVNLLNKLSCALFNQGRYDEDLEVTEAALALDPDEPVLYYRRGWTMWRLNRRDEAVELARRGLELDPHATLKLYLHQDLGRFHNWERRHDEAFAIAEQGLAVFPGDTELLEVAGEALRRQNRYHEADEYYKASISADPRVGTSWYGKALNDMSLGRARASLTGFARSMALDPDNGWRAERVRYFMSWPVAGFAAAFRWTLPLAAIAALLDASAAGSAWRWTGLGLLAVTFGYAVNWLYRGGRLSWTALARLLPLEKLSMAVPFLLATIGVATAVVSLATGDTAWAWPSLAAGVLIWPALGFDNALNPNEDRGRSLPRRALDCTVWWFADDFTGHPQRLWQRVSRRWDRRRTGAAEVVGRDRDR